MFRKSFQIVAFKAALRLITTEVLPIDMHLLDVSDEFGSKHEALEAFATLEKLVDLILRVRRVAINCQDFVLFCQVDNRFSL